MIERIDCLGVSMVTFDSEFQQDRRKAMTRNRPRHALHGVAQGAKSFVDSVTSGIGGVVVCTRDESIVL